MQYNALGSNLSDLMVTNPALVIACGYPFVGIPFFYVRKCYGIPACIIRTTARSQLMTERNRCNLLVTQHREAHAHYSGLSSERSEALLEVRAFKFTFGWVLMPKKQFYR